MQAMIFAAGLGTRLRPLTDHIPKALVEVQDRPMLDWVVRALGKAGVTKLVINTHYKAEQIERFCFEQLKGLEWYLSYEPEILGTGGGLKQASRWLTEDFFLVNADIFTNLDYRWFLKQHQASKAEITLAVNQAPASSELLVDQKNRLIGLRRPNADRIVLSPQGAARPQNFCGIHLINQSFLARLGGQVEFSIIEEYLKQIPQGLNIHCTDISPFSWLDIGTPADLSRAQTLELSRAPSLDF